MTAFLANQPTSVQYFGDLSEPSPFHNGATGLKHIEQEYYVGFAQDEWRVRPNFTLNYGLRYDYYVPLTEADNRIVKFNVVTGQIDPDTTPFYQSKKNSFQPRISATYSPTAKTVFKSGFGIFVGPGQTEDQIQPIEAERISTIGLERPAARVPGRSGGHSSQLHEQPEQPLVPAARVLGRLHASREGVPVHGVGAAGNRRRHGGVGGLRRQPGAESLPPQHHQPDRRRADEWCVGGQGGS